MQLPFHRALKKLVLDAFTRHAVSPEGIAKRLSVAMHRPCGKAEGQALLRWMGERNIERLVHFTPLFNVPAIVQYGLIARDYLQLEVVKLALGARFTDSYRLDQLPQYNCLSITSPNYSMFFSKRKGIGGAWAVIEFDPIILAQLYFCFSPTNTASCEIPPLGGVSGAERLFLLPEFRTRLGLLPCEPTDPQAEALCDSIVPASFIRAVYVESAEHAKWLRRQGIEVVVDDQPFKPRRDWQFWKGRRITDIREARNILFS